MAALMGAHVIEANGPAAHPERSDARAALGMPNPIAGIPAGKAPD